MNEKNLGPPKVSLQFELSSSGITRLVKADAAVEETYTVTEEEEVDDEEADVNETAKEDDGQGQGEEPETTAKQGEEEKKEGNENENKVETNMTSEEEKEKPKKKKTIQVEKVSSECFRIVLRFIMITDSLVLWRPTTRPRLRHDTKGEEKDTQALFVRGIIPHWPCPAIHSRVYG
jgi:hypothetical protein